MVKEILVSTILTDEMVKAGESYASLALKSGIKITSCFWLFSEESNSWKLIFVSPKVNLDGPRKLYQELFNLFGKKTEHVIPSTQISVMDSNHNFIKQLKTLVKTGKQISGIRITNNFVNDAYIPDAFIYFNF